jgi:hypothetical protein
MPRLDEVVVKVPEMFVDVPAVNTGVPVRVMPLFPAVMAVARVAAAVLVVMVTVADASPLMDHNTAGQNSTTATLIQHFENEMSAFKDRRIFKIQTHLLTENTKR